MSLFPAVEIAPRDPILGLNETFNTDTRPSKISLGVGVHYNEEGYIPLLRVVQAAERARIEAHVPRGYLPTKEIATYNQGIQKLPFGNESELLAASHVVTTQAAGDTGALKLGADSLKRPLPDATVVISDPSWENHYVLLEATGFPVQNYHYYNAASNGVSRVGLLEGLNALSARSIVVPHACCHNPTGVDLELDDWKQMLDVFRAGDHVPFLDIAHQGFGDGIEENAAAVRLLAQSGLSFFVSSPFSKSFPLYGERVGAPSIMTENRDELACVLSQVKRVIRTSYSNPPTHGASAVSSVLNSSELRALWERELGKTRDRIHDVRLAMVGQLATHGAERGFSFVDRQCDMFPYPGLTADQVERLKTEFGIYAVNTSRICIATPSKSNLETITKAIVQVP